MRYVRIYFTQDSEIEFLDPNTGRKAWYGSDYAKGTYIDVLDVVSGGSGTIKVKCTDGVVAILKTSHVRFA